MAKKDCSELAKTISDLAMVIAQEENVTNLDDVVAEIQKSFPVMPREEVVNSIVEAHATERKRADDLVKKLGDIKRNARMEKATAEKIAQIETYLNTGKLPEPPKPKRMASETLAQARKTLANLRKWLATADPAMKKALQSKLDSVNAQIESGDVVIGEQRELKLHETLQALQDQIDAARREISSVKVIKSLEAKIEELQGHLDAGTVPETKTQPERGTGPADLLRDIRDDLQKQIVQSEPAQKLRIEKQIADLNERIASGDIGPKEKLPEVPQSKELERLAYQRDRLRRDIRMAVMDLKPKTVWQRIADPFNAIRALKTSFDLSALFRQGMIISAAHPIRAGSAVVDMLKAFSSEQASNRINAEIMNRPNAPLYAKAKLYIAPIDGTSRLSQMEEAYMSKWAEKIPGVRASERAYLTFLNRLRADSFDTMVETLSKNREATLLEAKAVATFVNEATGRGSMGIEQAAVGLNTVFFAPKYTVSRFQMLAGHPLWGGTSATRKLIAGEYGRFLMGLAVVYILGWLAGGKIEDDPRSSDFGKMRFGKTRIDPLAGISQTVVLIGRVASGATKSTSTGEVSPIRGPDVPFGGATTVDVMARFLRSKLSPTFGVPLDLLAGKNAVGESTMTPGYISQIPVPMGLSDIYDAMKEEGVPEGTIMAMLSIFGMGLQTYNDKTTATTGRKSKL